MELGSHVVSVTASIGMAISGDDEDNADDLLREADLSMYVQKQQRRCATGVEARVLPPV